ncbi:hypothetical protein GOV06_00125 [Candidatus Woesearchaeota archaeon]|nr:hypothetical protein [Candidatus Woesearchaeota archaeon]
MGKKFKLVPFEKQDKLEENLLKAENGSYIKLSTATYWIDGEVECFIASKQDKLKDGFIKIPNGTYHRFDSIDMVEESDCFVATAVYGDINAPQVQKLREFRNEVLIPSRFGRAFVDFYYSGAGKRTADFIKEHLPSTIPIIRTGLDVLVERYSAQKK